MGLKSGISLTFFSPSLQKQPPEMLCKKGTLRSFAKFTGRDRGSYQRWSVRKGVLRNFAKCIGKLLCQIHFLLFIFAGFRLQAFFFLVFDLLNYQASFNSFRESLKTTFYVYQQTEATSTIYFQSILLSLP